MTPRLLFVLGLLVVVSLPKPTCAIEPRIEETAKLGDLSIFYRIYGDGEPLLLLHGYGSSGEENWGPFVNELAVKYKLVIPDLRGHGRSTNPIDEFTHRQAAKDMLQLLDHWVHKLGAKQIAQLRKDFYEFKDSYEDMNFTKPLLSTIRARTLIVHGDRDEHFPVEIPVEMYRSIPNASLWIVPEVGHVPMFKPNELFVPDTSFPFVNKMLAFLDAEK